MNAKPLSWALFFEQKTKFILFFKSDYLILTKYSTHALKTYLEKLRKKGYFTF